MDICQSNEHQPSEEIKTMDGDLEAAGNTTICVLSSGCGRVWIANLRKPL